MILRPLALALLMLLPGHWAEAPEPNDALPVVAVDLDLSRPLRLADVARFGDGSDRVQVAFTGLCGEPTKKGPPCRNKVRGGGPCWRHR